MQKVRKSAICLLMSMLCMLFVFSLAAPIDFSAASDKSITLECKKDDVILKGMRWKIYRAGERDGDSFVLTGNFAEKRAQRAAEQESLAGQLAREALLYLAVNGGLGIAVAVLYHLEQAHHLTNL